MTDIKAKPGRRLARIILAAALGMTASAACADEDPISKFDNKPPKAVYVSPRGMFDIERCLLDIQYPLPNVYRQPDRPDEVMMLWGGQTLPGVANSRIDMKRVANGTSIKSWVSEERIALCAPRQ